MWPDKALIFSRKSFNADPRSSNGPSRDCDFFLKLSGTRTWSRPLLQNPFRPRFPFGYLTCVATEVPCTWSAGPFFSTIVAKRFNERTVILQTYFPKNMKFGVKWTRTVTPLGSGRRSVIHSDVHCQSLSLAAVFNVGVGKLTGSGLISIFIRPNLLNGRRSNRISSIAMAFPPLTLHKKNIDRSDNGLHSYRTVIVQCTSCLIDHFFLRSVIGGNGIYTSRDETPPIRSSSIQIYLTGCFVTRACACYTEI